MSTATMPAPHFVQTHFNWDEEPILAMESVTKPETTSTPYSTTKRHENRRGSGSVIRSPKSAEPTNRMGGCVHVGSPLVKVLSKYGFTLDDLLVEIERQKKLAS